MLGSGLYRVFLVLLCSFTISEQLFAQQNSLNSEAWLHAISSRAIVLQTAGGRYRQAQPGPALYFAEAAGIRQPYIVCVPRGYDPNKTVPVIVFLHGASLALDSFQYREPAMAMEPIFQIADSLHALIVFPFARKDFKWTADERVFNNILTIIAEVGKHYHTDPGRCYIGGQSMGGNATFRFLRHEANEFAGFFTFSAHPMQADVQAIEGLPGRKRLYSVNAQDDSIVPFDPVKKLYIQNGKPGQWIFRTVNTGGHRFIYGKQGAEIMLQTLTDMMLNR